LLPGDADEGEAGPDRLDPEVADFARRLQASGEPGAALLRPLSREAREQIERSVLGAPRAKPAPRRARATFWVSLAAAMMVLGVAGYLVTRPAPEPVAYVLEVAGDRSMRGDTAPPVDEPVHVRPATELTVSIHPKTPVRDAALRVFLVRAGDARMVKPVFTSDGEGSFTIRSEAAQVFGTEANGAAELVLVVGAPMPDDEGVKRLAASPAQKAPRGLSILRRAMVFDGWSVQTLYGGCDAVRGDALCEVTGETKLRLWASLPSKRVAVRVDGREVEAERTEVAEGTRLVVAPGAGARAIALWADGRTPVLEVALAAPPDWPAALRRADVLKGQHKLDQAEEALAEVEQDGRPEVKLQSRRIRARIERRRLHADKADELLQATSTEAHSIERWADEVEDRLLMAYRRITQTYDFAAAERELDAAEQASARCPSCKIEVRYHRGLLAVEIGDFVRALALLRSVADEATALGLAKRATDARLMLVEVLDILGRYREATALSAQDAGPVVSADPCRRVEITTNRAWASLRAAGAQADHTESAHIAADAVAEARRGCQARLGEALLNLAFAEAAPGKTKEARAHLDEAARVKGPGDARFEAWSARLSIQLDLDENPARALTLAETLRARGEVTLSSELSFEAAFGKAQALDALGRDGAQAAYEEAAQQLDAWSELVPLGEGRATFFDRQDRASQAWIDFLVRRAERAPAGSEERAQVVRSAVNAAKSSLSRLFVTLASGPCVSGEEIGRYRRTRSAADEALGEGKPVSSTVRDALERSRRAAACQAGGRPLMAVATSNRHGDSVARALSSVDRAEAEVSLVYHPVRKGWVGFAIKTDGDISFARLGALDPRAPPEALAGALLAPFSEDIDRAARIRVPAHGPLSDVSFETLPWRGGLLADHAAILYGLDAPPRAAELEPPACGARPRAVVVFDSRGNLPAAARSGPEITGALEKLGWAPLTLAAKTATKQAVVEALTDPCTRLFHYEGHAAFAGRDGTQAALQLAGEEVLTVKDVQALPRVPEILVLAGCETAKDDGLGLAQVFLLRGARQVLATTQVVPDEASARIARRLYDHAPDAGEGVPDLATALRSSARSFRGERPGDADWQHFRVLAR
jgi:tetratricopeptide (TPR) repeat protein